MPMNLNITCILNFYGFVKGNKTAKFQACVSLEKVLIQVDTATFVVFFFLFFFNDSIFSAFQY